MTGKTRNPHCKGPSIKRQQKIDPPVRKMPALDNTPDCGRLLGTAPNAFKYRIPCTFS